MDQNTDRDQLDHGDADYGDADYGDSGEDGYYYEDARDARHRDPDYYWRRRFLVLAGGLAIVALITFGLSTLLGPAKPVIPPGAAPASLAVRDTPPAAGTGSPAASDSPSAAPSRAAPCSPSAMVLSLFTAKAEYGPVEQPQFEVYAVSTAPGACTLAFGPSFVQVVVVWHGHVLWDSAQCPLSLSGHRATATEPARFTQGVPQVADLSWNRQARNPGCAGSVPAGASGRVDAVVLAAGKSSPARSFTLLR
jgi:hypothetical protein